MAFGSCSLEEELTFLRDWNGRRVFLTGHTGFKGSWLALWLDHLGASVTGFGLVSPTEPSLYLQAEVASGLKDIRGDITDPVAIREAIRSSQPEVVIHLAAQSLVRQSYLDPLGTYRTNVIGTANLLDAVRFAESVRSVVIVTSDKCYLNDGGGRAYAEGDRLGGADPYSNSKACAEHVVDSYRTSFFSEADSARVATVRAGNVIGACDWAPDRLIPDLVRSAEAKEAARIRYPESQRPWQHVLDCLAGYLLVADALLEDRSAAAAWNFGPDPTDVYSVRQIADDVAAMWPGGLVWKKDGSPQPPEATTLRLDSSKARTELLWTPRLSIKDALRWTLEGYIAAKEADDLRKVLLQQIERYSVSLGKGLVR